MPTASEQVYAELRRGLAAGLYAPGEHLREEEIAGRLGVSRTPVREAVRRLSAEGWVRTVPNLGSFVAQWTMADIEEIFALRALLEPHAAEQAALRASAEDVAELSRWCELGDEAVFRDGAPDLEEVGSTNLAFHKAVLRIAGQRRTEAIVVNLYAMPIILKSFELYDAAHLRRSMRQHRELTEAVAARDARWAGAVMRAHVEAAKALFLRAPAERIPGRLTP